MRNGRVWGRGGWVAVSQLVALTALLLGSEPAHAARPIVLYDVEDGIFVRNWNRLFFEVEAGRISTLEGFDGGVNITNTANYTNMYFIGGIPNDYGDMGNLMVSWGIHWMFAKLEPAATPAFWIEEDDAVANALRAMFALTWSKPLNIPIKLQLGAYGRLIQHNLEADSAIVDRNPHLQDAYLSHKQREFDFGPIYHATYDGKTIVSNLTYKGRAKELVGAPEFFAQDFMVRIGENLVVGPYYLLRASSELSTAASQVGVRGSWMMPQTVIVNLLIDGTGYASGGRDRYVDSAVDALKFSRYRVKVGAELLNIIDPLSILVGAWTAREWGTGGQLGVRLNLYAEGSDRLYMDLVGSFNEVELDPLLGRSDGFKLMFDYAI